MPNQYQPVRNGMSIPAVGKNKFLSASIRQLLKALANPMVHPPSLGAKVVLSDGNWMLDLGNLSESKGGSSGGSGSVQQCIIDNNAGIAAIYADYMRCLPSYGTGANQVLGTAIYVAKPPYLRESLWPEKTFYDASGTQRTVTYTYSVSGLGDNARVRDAAVSGLSVTQTEVPLERYRAGDLIYAIAVDHTNVNDPNGDEITWLDMNVDARRWVRFYGQ